MPPAKTGKTEKSALESFTERDLTADLADLTPAYGVDDVLARLCDVIASRRSPVLVGESGIGKTAVIHELVRRAAHRDGFGALAGRQILQLSFRRRLAQLGSRNQIGRATEQLVDALVGMATPPVVFLRDVHLVLQLGLESHLEALVQQLPTPLLCEANGPTWDAQIEDSPEIDQILVTIRMDEPRLREMESLVEQWRIGDPARRERFHREAASEGLHLCHRFLARVRDPRRTVDFLGQVEATVPVDRPISRDDVIEWFYRSFRVPRFLIDPAVPFDVGATVQDFMDRVVGQREAVHAVVQLITRIRAGLSDARRPLGSMFFAGPTGVGKTHLAQLLAEHLFGQRDRLVRLNMADYQEPHDAGRLFGESSAYSLAEKRGALTSRMLGRPFAVVLLDEFEKAHERVTDRFLQLIDEGAFINGAGETISCRSAILIATSNVGAEVYRERALGFGSRASLAELDHELDRRLFSRFRHEFLNRFDHVVHFHPLSRSTIRTVARREIEALAQRPGLRFSGLSLRVDDAVLDWLAVHGYDAHFGARHLKRCIERNVTAALAEVLVDAAPGASGRVDVRVRGERIVASRATEPDLRQVVELSRGAESVRKRLGPEELRSQARELLLRADKALCDLDTERALARALLERMTSPGFWSDPIESADVARDYRKRDVLNRIGASAAAACARVRELVDHPAVRDPDKLTRLASALTDATRSLREWETRRADAGPSEIWLLVHNADSVRSAPTWIADLVEIELSWCRHLKLDAEVVAYGERDGALARAVLLVSGAGAARFLAMERGLHERPAEAKGLLSARIHVIDASEDAEPRHTLTPRRARGGAFGIEARWGIAIEREAQGEMIDLVAADRRLLAHFAHDLANYLESVDDSTSGAVARTYETGGAGARDPRTGAVVARYRDAKRGHLDVLLDAYLAHRSA